jgi:hypothetical protein
MDDRAQTIKAALDVVAVAWPLAAGLTVVLWSKLRARQPEPVPVRVRGQRRG